MTEKNTSVQYQSYYLTIILCGSEVTEKDLWHYLDRGTIIDKIPVSLAEFDVCARSCQSGQSGLREAKTEKGT